MTDFDHECVVDVELGGLVVEQVSGGFAVGRAARVGSTFLFVETCGLNEVLVGGKEEALAEHVLHKVNGAQVAEFKVEPLEEASLFIINLVVGELIAGEFLEVSDQGYLFV